MLNTGAQGLEFLSSLYVGVLIGLFYEACRLVRRLCRSKRIVGIIMDTLFWIGTGVLFFAAMYIINGARFRWFLFLGTITGMVLHFYSTGIIINKVYDWVYRKVRNTSAKVGEESGSR